MSNTILKPEGKSMSDIVRRKESITQDFEKKTVNGFVGLFLHIIFGFFNLFWIIFCFCFKRY